MRQPNKASSGKQDVDKRRTFPVRSCRTERSSPLVWIYGRVVVFDDGGNGDSSGSRVPDRVRRDTIQIKPG